MRFRLLSLSITIIIVFTCLTTSGCGQRFEDFDLYDVLVEVHTPGTEEINVDVIFESVTAKVRETLPRAYFQDMTWSGPCSELGSLRGTLRFMFIQTSLAIPRELVLLAFVSVDTSTQLMKLSFKDVSRNYKLTDSAPFFGDSVFREVAAMAQREVEAKRLCGGNVVISQVNDSWQVTCGEVEDFNKDCKFDIVDGEIREPSD